MPISYEIDRELGRIQTRCYGQTTLAEVVEHFDVLRSPEMDLSGPLDVRLDLSEMIGAPERDQLRAVVGEMKTLPPQLHFGALAIVAPGDLLFGMSRMLGIFAEGLFAGTGVFRTLADADRWLDGQRRARRPR